MVSPVVPPGHAARDAFLERLERDPGRRVTREEYIAAATAGGADTIEWSAEHEADLPPDLQDWAAFHREAEAEQRGP